MGPISQLVGSGTIFQVDSVRLELNCRTPSWCRDLLVVVGKKAFTYLVTAGVGKEVFSVKVKETHKE